MEIRYARYVHNGREMRFELPEPAAGFSRYVLDRRLAERASSKGFRLLTDTRVSDLRNPEENGNYNVTLDSGDTNPDTYRFDRCGTPDRQEFSGRAAEAAGRGV